MVQISCTLSSISVKKRNGQEVLFFEIRIYRAIASAFKAFYHIPHESELPSELDAQVKQVTGKVVQWCEQTAAREHVLFIEDIQDTVIRELQDAGFTPVALLYKSYRDTHEQKRFEEQRITVQKRDGRTVSFKPEKITLALSKAFLAAKADEPLLAEERSLILNLTDQIVKKIHDLNPRMFTLGIEQIQDLVVLALMEANFHDIARRYIHYREERRHARVHQKSEHSSLVSDKTFTLLHPDGTLERMDVEKLKFLILEACHGLEEDVSWQAILKETLLNCTEKMAVEKIFEAMILAVRPMTEKDPAYASVAGRLLLRKIYTEVKGEAISREKAGRIYPELFKESIEAGVRYERLLPQMLDFDLTRLGQALQSERDLQFQFMGLQILYDRYFIHHQGRRLETPQIFWMRVAMGLALNEGEEKNEKAIEFYDVLSSFRFCSSTPTLFNAGTRFPQLSSCFLTTVGDDLDHIFKCVKDNAMLSKWSGGLGNDWSPVRAMGARIKGTNGKSQGIVPFLKVANDTAVAVNQGGKRQGAVCAYLECWHLDVEEFLELRKNTGDERRRTHDMHTANWIPDLFMKRVLQDELWTLFSPDDAADLHDCCGEAFEKKYAAYEALAKSGKIKHTKSIRAIELWRKMLTMLFETGHPWITFKDPSNIRSPQDHTGVVHSSNLCTEILLNTSKDETAVCNLGSVNLAAHTTPAGINRELFNGTIGTAIRMLDNVIDLNFYPTVEARTANLRHRPIGLGLMGFQDALYIQGISYGSLEAAQFADESMELISYNAILSSSNLAAERGTYGSYSGSKWDRGLLPLDTLNLLEKERGGYLEVDRESCLDWTPVREAIKKNGMRNSNTMAIAPTATIGQITGVTQSIEPTYKHLFTKSNLSGEFTSLNPYLVSELKALGIWDEQMIDDLKYFDGNLYEIERIPQNVKKRFLTAFDIDYEWIIECASRRQKWIDMGQSLNLYLQEPSGKKLHSMYMLAWKKGLKTTYYLRTLGATRIEKSTLDAKKYQNTIGRKSFTAEEAAQCRIDNKEDCEACQ